MNKRVVITLVALTMVCQAFVVRAAPSQQQQTEPVPTGLALEVTYDKDRPPVYAMVPGPDSKMSGVWYSFFRRVADWQPPAGSLPIRAVNFLSRLEGDSVRIEVSVYLGARFFEKEEPVATYRVRENEKISVEGLTRFGAEPFEVKVVRVNPLFTKPPSIVNKTNSIEVVGIKVNNSTLPSYTVTLHNLSGKNVDALGINVFVAGRKEASSLPRGKQGECLIEAGATQDILVLGVEDARMTPGGYLPDAPPNLEVIITAAIFEDGSYEGEVETAARFRGARFGDRIQIPRLIALLQEALNSTNSNIATTLEKLKAQASSLSTDVETAALNDFLRAFPALSQEAKVLTKIAIEVALAREKFDSLKWIEEFEKTAAQSTDAKAFRAWLNTHKERYEKRLSKL